MAEPRISVVIPTRDRRATLLETLDALDAQDLPAGDAELIVVDNGSTDGTPEALAARTPGPFGLQVLREARPGPAAARNRGWEAARAPLVLFLGDDMIPAGPGLLAGHLAHGGAAVLGRVTWRPDRPVTPFMAWLEHGGPQFPFDTLAPGPVEPAKYLFTSNVSLPRAAVAEAGGFDERFPFAAVEDAELGVRLQQRGLTLVYDPALLVHHDHPQDPVAYVGRMERSGASAALLQALHPGDTTATLPAGGSRWGLLRRLHPVLRQAVRLPWRGALGARVWSAACVAGYARGLERAEALLPAVAEARRAAGDR
jgi:glycosyltransferase involved in cell wall biosynthesis